MRFQSLQPWLDWQQTLHHKTIDPGLSRTRLVAERLGISPPPQRLITVAGTNGKGSSVAYYEAALQAAGFQTGVYSSPHVLRYNERIRLNGREATDAQIVSAFAAIDAVREDLTLSYFEFGTLAAMWLMQRQRVDYWILEVGLGGRLDAVNILDADLAHITMIGLDHQQWLGHTRAEIALEKGGILRHGCQAVYNDPEPVPELLALLEDGPGQSSVLGRDYRCKEEQSGWFYHSQGLCWKLPDLHMQGPHQRLNLAGVISGLRQLPGVDLDIPTLLPAMAKSQRAGRMQWLSIGRHSVLLDVGHNEAAAQVLSDYLQTLKQSGVGLHLLLAMLEDKDPVAFVKPLLAHIETLFLSQFEDSRSLSASALQERLAPLSIPNTHQCRSVEEAVELALKCCDEDDIVVVCGSFHTVEAVLRYQA